MEICRGASTYNFEGLGNLSGQTGLTKQGPGTFILANNGSNDFTGDTLISSGTLMLSNSASIANSGNVNVGFGATLDVNANPAGALLLSPGQTLEGNGALNGSLVVNPGSFLSPGTSIGTLTITNSVTLNGLTFIELNKSLQTNDTVRSFATINYGGTLRLTNVAGILNLTDTFRIFVASTYSGAFTNILPATTGTGLAWDTSQLAVNGAIRFAPLPKPGVNSAVLLGNKLVVNGTNGIPGGPYVLLTSTNLAMPLNAWLTLTTNNFDFSGRFSYTNSTIVPQQFFVIQAF